MALRLAPIATLTDTQLDSWRELARRAAEPNPFFEPGFVLPAARHLGGKGVCLLTVEEGENWVACMPVRRRARGPFKTLAAWNHSYCYLGTPLVDPAALATAGEELLGVIDGHRTDFLRLEDAGREGPVMGAVLGAIGARGYDTVFQDSFERPMLDRPGKDQQVGLTGRKGSELRRQRRKLGEALGEGIEVVDRSEESAAIEEFLRIEASGWKGENGTALASRVAHADFFREMCAQFAAQGRLRLLSLQSERRTLAMTCDLAAGDTIFCFKLGFDEKYSSYSPGVQLLQASAEDFRDSRPERRMDSCASETNELMARLWQGRRPLATIVASKPGVRSALSRLGMRTAQAARRRGRTARNMAASLGTWASG